MRNCRWKSLFIAFFLPATILAQGNSYTWWNNLHEWDLYTHWSSYMKTSPAFMGPNAFPIPLPERMVKIPEFDFRYSHHFNRGEISWDFYSRFSIPFGDKASLKFQINPLEYFKLDSILRNERVARDEFPEAFAIGDLLVEMNALVYDNDNKQLLFNVGFKTASGSQFRNARYTDTPGYYLNLSYYIRKMINPNITIDYGALLGLYVWQTYAVNHRQNDAILAAFLFSFNYKEYEISQHIRGFRGYLENGDFPLIYALNISKKWDSYQLYLQYQQSLHDYPYNSIQIGCKYYF